MVIYVMVKFIYINSLAPFTQCLHVFTCPCLVFGAEAAGVVVVEAAAAAAVAVATSKAMN